MTRSTLATAALAILLMSCVKMENAGKAPEPAEEIRMPHWDSTTAKVLARASQVTIYRIQSPLTDDYETALKTRPHVAGYPLLQQLYSAAKDHKCNRYPERPTWITASKGNSS